MDRATRTAAVKRARARAEAETAWIDRVPLVRLFPVRMWPQMYKQVRYEREELRNAKELETRVHHQALSEPEGEGVRSKLQGVDAAVLEARVLELLAKEGGLRRTEIEEQELRDCLQALADREELRNAKKLS